ncbi:MAG: DUF3284 domain-containing protein [Clostridiaceae bacterium]
MLLFEDEIILDYSVNDVFSIFVRTAKRDFPKFNEKNPIGTKTEKKTGSRSFRKTVLSVEITDYEKNKVYEITSISQPEVYVSRYEFGDLGNNRTKLTLKESDDSTGFFSVINKFLMKFVFRFLIKRKFDSFISALKDEVQVLVERRDGSHRRRIETQEEHAESENSPEE